jgi:patatin-like phospholipase/acyl hydrolase
MKKNILPNLLNISRNKNSYNHFRKNPLANRNLPLQGDFFRNKFAADKKMTDILFINKFKNECYEKVDDYCSSYKRNAYACGDFC